MWNFVSSIKFISKKHQIEWVIKMTVETKKINDTDWIVKNNLSSWKKLTIVCKKITRTGFLQATRTAYGTDRVKFSKASK